MIFHVAVRVLHADDLAEQAVDALPHDGSRLIHVHLAGPAQHLLENSLMDGRIHRHHSGRVQGLANETGNAVERCLHPSYPRPTTPPDGPLVHLIQPAVGSRLDTVEPELLELRLHAREGHEPGGTDRGEAGWVGEENHPLAFVPFREIDTLFR